MRVRRAATSANSAATKNAFASTSATSATRRTPSDPDTDPSIEAGTYPVLTRLQAPPYDALAARLPAIRCQEALARIPGRLRDALELAVERVRGYHEKQVERGFLERHADGSALGMRVAALDRVGVYVPGGIAGVREIVMVTPPVLPAPPAPPAGTPDVVLAAARLAGVTRVFRVGGAQAIAALAYGTVTIPRVDKIVGPGNRFVTEAKRQVAGHVGIDMLAGPTEVLIIA